MRFYQKSRRKKVREKRVINNRHAFSMIGERGMKMNGGNPDYKRRQRKKRRWALKINILVRRLCIAALLIAGMILAVNLLKNENKPTAQKLQENISPLTPIILPTQTVSLTNMSQTTEITPQSTANFQRNKAEGYLVLVNWDHQMISKKRPDNLVLMGDILDKGIVTKNEDNSINKVAGKAANEMFKAAKSQGIGRYYITSAYRSISYQDTLFLARVKEDPDYANDPFTNPVRVMPGNCSEHATGLALDILSENHKNADDDYGDTPEGKWLQENAYIYGFILRYPKDKEHITGVIYEPWHYRYVGIEAAKEMYELGVCLEEYVE